MKINSFSTSSQQINNNADKAKTSGEKALQNIAAARALEGTDSATLAIANALLGQSNILEQGIANANDAIGMLGIADSTLANLTKNADRLNELSVRHNNAALGDKERAMISSQADALKSSMSQSLQGANFNGKNIFSGELNFATGASLQTINLSNQNVSANIASIDIKDQKSIENFTNSINDLRANIGSAQNAIASEITNTLKQSVALRQSESQMKNNDIAKNVAEQKQSDLALNAATLAQAHNTELLKAQIDRLLS